MKKLVLILIILLPGLIQAQDAQFSQYFTTTTLINPAFAGITPEIEFSTNYKRAGTQQDQNFFELTQATVVYPLKILTSQEHQIGGIGATVYRERRGFQGIFTSQKVLLSGAYTAKLSTFSNNFLAFGLQAGLVQNKIANEVLTWGSQFNRFFGFDDTLPGELINANNALFPTFNLGVLYTVYDNENLFVRDKSFIVGFSADNLNTPVTGEDDGGQIRKNILYKIFSSIKLSLGPRFYFHPSVLGLSQSNNYQLNLGFYLSTIVNSNRSRTSVLMHVGSWYRQGDSFILLGGFEVQRFRAGVSFDLNSEVFTENIVFQQVNTSYEVSLSYTFASSNRVRKVSNPVF